MFIGRTKSQRKWSTGSANRKGIERLPSSIVSIPKLVRSVKSIPRKSQRQGFHHLLLHLLLLQNKQVSECFTIHESYHCESYRSWSSSNSTTKYVRSSKVRWFRYNITLQEIRRWWTIFACRSYQAIWWRYRASPYCICNRSTVAPSVHNSSHHDRRYIW